MARKSAIAVVVLGLLAWMQPPLVPRPPACATGRFVADGTSAPVIELRDGTISLPGRCPPIQATFAAPQRRGTGVRATWRSCEGPGRLHLRGRLDADCAAFHGVLSDAGGVRPFNARRAAAVVPPNA
jgi:hypothetical protein